MSIKQPADKSHFILPDLGEGVHEAELVKWKVKIGDKVDEHQTLAEMETDKALVEVPSPWAGVIKELHGKEGEILNVGNKLVSYDVSGSGNGRAAASPAKSESKKAKEAPAAQRSEDAGTVVGNVSGELKVSDRFARRQPETATAKAGGKARTTPSVRRIAKEMGVDIDEVPGSGRGGRVMADDVQAFAGSGSGGGRAATSARAVTASPDLPAPSLSKDGIAQRIPFRGVRRKIAQSLERSVRTAVHFTVVDEADVTELDKKRREYAAVIGRKLSFLPFIMAAVCKALKKHPAMNANVDDANEEILIKDVINLGCAVDTEHGLMVPVIANADRRSIVDLADAVGELAAGCRDRTIAREKLIGGTFTISNVGSYGGMFATPIINYPEVGILAVGRGTERVLTKNGTFYAGKVLPLSMSCDHRVVDGAEGARFLNTVRGLLENPEGLLK